MKIWCFILSICFCQLTVAQNKLVQQLPLQDSIIQLQFKSKLLGDRNISIWLPASKKGAENEKLSVVYMHDGQMLFDSSQTWNKQEWKVDETLQQLFLDSNYKRCMVVGIWNNGPLRHYEYSPENAIQEFLNPQERAQLMAQYLQNKKTDATDKQSLLGNLYLQFLVQELKPYIDQHYPTLADANNTAIMGSSMGGIISFYGICEYPSIFGTAICLSTHWPGFYALDHAFFQQAILAYANNKIPKLPKSSRLYFDRGTTTLDSLYEFGQNQINQILQKHLRPKQFETLVFKGANHTEKSWADRLAIPFKFALKKEELR